MSAWNTGDPPIPHRVYVTFCEGGGSGYYGLGVWTGKTWVHFGDDPPARLVAWMFLPDGPGETGSGQPRRVRVQVDP